MQYAQRPPDPTMPVSGCLREINMRFDSLPLIECLPCTRRRKYFAVLLKWKAGHIVLYFLCVWAKLFNGSGCFSSCQVIRRWKMKNEAIRSVGYVMIICMQGNSNLRGPAPKKRPMIADLKIKSGDFYLPSRAYRILFKDEFFLFQFRFKPKISSRKLFPSDSSKIRPKISPRKKRFRTHCRNPK